MELKVFLVFLCYLIQLNGANGASSVTVGKHKVANESVFVCRMGEKTCDLNDYNGYIKPFREVESVQLVQPNILIKKGTPPLCEIFWKVRRLELSFEYLNEPGFIDCEFHLLDELIMGGKLLDKTFEQTFKRLLKKNTRIQRITFKTPTNYRAYQLIQKYLKNLQEVRIFDKFNGSDDGDDPHEIFIPSVRKLVMNFTLESGCHPPMDVILGGAELQELLLSCYDHEQNYSGYGRNGRSYKFFSTLYRYPNIKSLNAGLSINDYDLLKMVGKFPHLIKAKFMVDEHFTSDTIAEFIENCDQLKVLQFDDYVGLTDLRREELETRIGDKFKIIASRVHRVLRLERNGSNALKFVTTGLVSLLLVTHILRAFLL